MTSILQKRLEELEYELDAVFHLPLEKTPGPRHEISFDDIKQRLDFLRRILEAESTSQPLNPQLPEFEAKLCALKASFLEWNESRMSAVDSGAVSPQSVNAGELLEIRNELTLPESAFRELEESTISAPQDETASSEIASQPQNAGELLEIGNELTAPESAFRELEESTTSAPNDETASSEIASQPHNAGELVGTTEKFAAVEAAFRESPISVRNNYKYDLGDKIFMCSDYDSDDAPSICSGCLPHMVQEDDFQESSARNEEIKEGRKWRETCKYWGVFGRGVIVGAFTYMIMVFVVTEYEVSPVFPPPT